MTKDGSEKETINQGRPDLVPQNQVGNDRPLVTPDKVEGDIFGPLMLVKKIARRNNNGMRNQGSLKGANHVKNTQKSLGSIFVALADGKENSMQTTSKGLEVETLSGANKSISSLSGQGAHHKQAQRNKPNSKGALKGRTIFFAG